MYLVRKSESAVYDKDLMTEKEKLDVADKKFDYADTEKEAMSLLNGTNKRQIFDRLTKNIMPEIINLLMDSIKEQTQKEVVKYMQGNNRCKIVMKTSSDQKKNFTVLCETKSYLVADMGEFNPLDYLTVHEFLSEPTAETCDDRQKTIAEIISVNLAFDMKDILPTIKKHFTRSKAKRGFLNYFVETDYFKKHMTERLTEYIEEFVYADKNAGFMSNRFYDFYREGCAACGIAPKEVEYVIAANPVFEEIIYNAILPYKESRIPICGINTPSMKNIVKVNNKNNNAFKKVISMEVENSIKMLGDRIKAVRKYFGNAMRYKLFCDSKDIKYEDLSDTMLREIARLEAIRYEVLEITVNISDICASNSCAKDILVYGLDYVMEYTYVKEETKKSIVSLIPASPELEYPNARDMERHFILHYGPTNSGKTFQAIEALKKAESGVYLGPLRLLALEIQDNLMSNGILCSLLTGEEEDIVDGAKHMASTVEKLNLEERYDVCVIDEAQMIDDKERGFAWTRAILGVQAKEIHICMAPEALTIIKNLIELCGDTCETVEHERRSSLVVHKNPIKVNAKTVEDGDAYIVFSKKKVLQVAADLVKQGVRVSMIYGNLPYPVRKEQVKRFINGDTQVVVSTNAIGMGINLPVRRIVFLEDSKFDGTEIAPLTITDVKQIAGRAGRNKETGHVCTMLPNGSEIQDMLNAETPEIKNAYLGFSDIIIGIDAPLSDILRVWRSIATPDMFKRMDIDRYISLDACIYVDVTKREKLKMITIPFDERNTHLLEQWKDYCRAFENGDKELVKPLCKGNVLQQLEEYCQALDLWYSFSRNFGYEIDIEWLRKEKSETSEKINDILVKNTDMFQKKCEYCGKPMHWTNPFKTCKNCYEDIMVARRMGFYR